MSNSKRTAAVFVILLFVIICSVKSDGVTEICLPDQLNLRSNLCLPCGGRQSGTQSNSINTRMSDLKLFLYGKLTDIRRTLNRTMTHYDRILVNNEWEHLRNFSFVDLPTLPIDFDEEDEEIHSALTIYQVLSDISMYMKLATSAYARRHNLRTRSHGIQSDISTATCYLKRIAMDLQVHIPTRICRKRISMEETENSLELASWIYSIVRHSRRSLENSISLFLEREQFWE